MRVIVQRTIPTEQYEESRWAVEIHSFNWMAVVNYYHDKDMAVTIAEYVARSLSGTAEIPCVVVS